LQEEDQVSLKAYGASRKQGSRRELERKLAIPLVVGFVGIGVLLVGLVLLVISGFSPSAAASAPQVGRPLVDFTLTDLSGKQVQLSDYAGRPVLINAWATWCPPCRAEMPDLQQLYQRHEKEGFVVLAVNAGEDASIVKSFIQQNMFTFPVLQDPQMALLDGFGIRSYPTSIVVGRDGKVKLVQVGMLTPDAIKSVVEPLLRE
jgi:peroxiredoxin